MQNVSNCYGLQVLHLGVEIQVGIQGVASLHMPWQQHQQVQCQCVA